MVSRAGGYYGTPFKGYWGITQVDTSSPTIFNIVVYSIIRNWVTVVVVVEAGSGGFGSVLHSIASFSHSKNCLLASTQPGCLRGAFNILTGLFNWAGL